MNIYGHTYLRLDGATGVDRRQRYMDRFNNDTNSSSNKKVVIVRWYDVENNAQNIVDSNQTKAEENYPTPEDAYSKFSDFKI